MTTSLFRSSLALMLCASSLACSAQALQRPSLSDARTLLVGADANKNHVRDDIEPVIEKAIGAKGTAAYAAAINYVATFGDVVAYSEATNTYTEAEIKRLGNAAMCFVHHVRENTRDKSDELMKKLFDTSPRAQMMVSFYKRAEVQDEGKVETLKGEKACQFNRAVRSAS